MTTPKCRHFHCKVYLVSQIAFRHLKEYRTAYSGALAPEIKKWRHRSVAISIVRFIWNFQIAFRHLKEYRKPNVRKTLEIYGVDEGSRTPGLQDHNLAL